MERIKIDLTPSCMKPVLRASQYDNGREWPCDVLKDGTPYKFVEGDVCEIHVRKGDGCGVTASVPVTVGQSSITITSTEQMCAVYGDNIGELVVTNGTKKIGSCNLILSVESDPMNGSKSSNSEIHDLQNQVNDCVDEALSHKGASDIAFDNTDTGLEATNVQSAIEEVNTKTDAKADSDDVYDKTYIDNALTGVNNSLNAKMDKNNPVGTGSFSLNRKANTTIGSRSVATGSNTTASGGDSHSEGYKTIASGAMAHAEGYNTTASGESSHSEGYQTSASGNNSHSEGYQTSADGSRSHAEGSYTIANHRSQHVSGEYNAPDDSTASPTARGNYVEIVGNGLSTVQRSNARTLDWSGNEVLAGDLTYNGNKSITSEVARLDSRIDALPDAMIFKGTLGVGGTITALPTASASNEGWTYKVITAGTYAGQYADIGDCFTCYEASENVFSWTISSKGDTDTDTWRAIKVNGVEKLGNGISSGSLDVVDTDNIEAEFDNDGNKLKIKTKNIYTQSEVDTLIANAIDSVLPTDSVSKSAVATFETDLAKPIEFKAYIEAVQASGTPTPSTPLPISGVSSVKIARTNGDNSALITALRGLLLGTHNFVKFEDLSLSYSNNSGQWNCYLFYSLITNKARAKAVLCSDYPVVGGLPQDMSDKQCTAPAWNDYFYVRDDTYTTIPAFTSAKGNAILIYECDTPITPTITLEQFNTICQAFGISGETVTIALGGTYYGGHFTQDKAGHRQFEVTHKAKVKLRDVGYWNYSASENRFYVNNIGDVYQKTDWNNHIGLCECYVEGRVGNNQGDDFAFGFYNASLYVRDSNYSDVTTWLNAVGDYYITYQLATPIIIDLPDGEPIATLIGTNNIFADSGDMECSYKCGVAMYVDNHSGGGNRSLAKSGGDESIDEPKEEVKEEPKEEKIDEPITRQER